MRLTQAGPGYMHVPKALVQTDEFEQMTAARLLPIVVQGKHSMRWTTPGGKREEAGDCMVYAYAGACHLGIQTFREASWERRETKYAPREPDLFSTPTHATPEKDTKTDPTQRQAVTDSYKKTTAPLTPAAAPATPPRTRPQGQGRDW